MARRQHGVITRRQLDELGFSRHEIEHRVRIGRLHRKHQGVFAVGHPDLSVPLESDRRRPGIRVYQAARIPEDLTRQRGVPVTTPVRTLIDLAACSPPRRVEIVINAADRSGLVRVDRLREELELRRGQRGVGALRRLLDARTFRLTDSELERRLLRLVREAGLPVPQTRARVNGYTVDFYWSDFGLAVETDGLRYHRTPEQQAHDRRREQDHTAVGLTCLRFTHEQVTREPARVAAVLARTLARLRRAA